MKKTLMLATLAVIGFGLPAHAQLAGTYIIGPDPGNQAVDNGGGTYTMTSTSTTYSWVDFNLNQQIAFSQLTDVNAVFNDISGGAGGGAPRLTIYFSNGGDVNIFLGTAPDYTDTVVSLNTWSGVNLIGNNDTGRYDNSNDGLGGGSPYTTYANVLAQDGNLDVTDIQITLDGGWAVGNGLQELTLDSINASGTAAVPEASTYMAGAMLLLPLGASTLRILRKTRKA